MTKRIFKCDVGKFSVKFSFTCGDTFIAKYKGRNPMLVDGVSACYKEVYVTTADDLLGTRLASYRKSGFIRREDVIYPITSLLKVEILDREVVMESLLVEELDELPEGINFDDLEIADE